MNLFMFAAGASTASCFAWLCDDKTCARLARLVYLIEHEPHVDMQWFDETLFWSDEFKKDALRRHKSATATRLSKKEEEENSPKLRNRSSLAAKFEAFEDAGSCEYLYPLDCIQKVTVE